MGMFIEFRGQNLDFVDGSLFFALIFVINYVRHNGDTCPFKSIISVLSPGAIELKFPHLIPLEEESCAV